EGGRLRLGALYPLMARLLAQPAPEIVQIDALLGGGVGGPGEIAAQREQVHVNAREPIGVAHPQPRGDEGAPVASLRGEASVTEDVGHEAGEGVGDLAHSEAWLPGREGTAVAEQLSGQRR